MKNRRFLRVYLHLLSFAIGTAVLSFSPPGAASEGRYQALSSNPMVDDMVDIVDYPGMTAAYSNELFLNIMQVAPFGNAGFLVGDAVVGGAWINRRVRFDDFAKTDELFNFSLPTAYNIADLFLGTRIGFGLRLSLLAGLDTLDQRLTASEDLYSDGSSLFGIKLVPGFSFDTGGYHGDFGIGLSFAVFEVALGGRSAYKNKWIPSMQFRHRSIIGPQRNIAWILDLGIAERNYGAKAQGANTADGLYNHVIGSLVVGPRFKLPADLTIWGGFRLLVEHLSGEVASFPMPKQTALGAPGLVVSAEVDFLERFSFRAGVNYDVYWTRVSQPDSGDFDGDSDMDEIIAKRRGTGQRFSWSSGFGVSLGAFQIDATVAQNLYLSGPDFIGGNAPGFLGMLSATYMW